VILVKLDNPKGRIGGKTAAPVSKVVLEAATRPATRRSIETP
jgi:hypothetical protein